MFLVKNKNWKSEQYWTTFLICLIILLIIKTLLIFYPIRLDSSDQTYLYYLWNDIPILFIILLNIIINTYLKTNKQRLFLNIISIIIILHYYIDTILIVYFQSRALIPEIFQFITLWTISTFIWYWSLLSLIFIILLIISSLISKSIKFKKNDIIEIIVIFIIYLWIQLTYWNKIKFMGNILTLNPIYRIANWWYYQPKCNTTYNDQIIYEEWEWKNLNIILIFLESFSAIDSKNAWWVDNLPLFDKIQNDWITFTNFLSQGYESSSAHVSTLYWVIPWRNSWYKSHNYIMKPLPEFLNNEWYNTTFISAADTSFLNQRTFLKESWFKKIIGEEAFEKAEYYTFFSAPDEYLYKTAINELLKQEWKFFIWMQTISFHKPYETPYWNTQELALKYSEDKLFDFYNELKKTNFFNSWILILVWDHRMMNPIKPWELSKFWESWQSRTVATVIWSWINSWEINNNIIQHTDIYSSIKKLVWSWRIELDKYYNNIFTNKSNRNRSISIRWWSTASKNRYDIYYKNWAFKSLETDEIEENLEQNIYEYICTSLALHDQKIDNILKIHK
jgi:hypothetical protein